MKSLARRVGVLAQAVVLGVLLYFAVIQLLLVAGADSVFHYQGF